VVIGDQNMLARCARQLALPINLSSWQPGRSLEPDAINVFNVTSLGEGLVWGKPDAETGRAMASYIETAVRLLQHGDLVAMVTCPISKAALQAAGYLYPGHTEMLAALSGAREVGMMMAGKKLRVTLVTIHKRLAEVPAAITRASVVKTITMTHETLRCDFGIAAPKIAVAGLNPHGGEEGLFGDEESREITPAIHAARLKGWLVDGPFPPDTLFNRAAAGSFDAVVCMYHDQGLIPFKLLHFEDGVNVTMGLPIVRTSVDHGTAYDIAGKGLANPASLVAAVAMAAEIAENRRRCITAG